MTFFTDLDRNRILDAQGHVLVKGGPGSGKTTVALRKALLRIEAGLLPGQRVLFLSFSRAAVARIVQSARRDLPRALCKFLEIQTFHSFCWQIIRGHGYLLGAPSPVRVLLPHDERAMREGSTDEDGEWDAKREWLFSEEGRIAFDLFAPKALSILQCSRAHRELIADRFPMIIVDEAQDTGTQQWGCVEVLADLSQIVCLADLDQQIYDFRRDVSPERLHQIMAALNPLEVDLGADNNRSHGTEIVTFSNDVLLGTPRGSAYAGVSHIPFSPDSVHRDRAIRQAVGILSKKIAASTGTAAESIGYLTNWGRGVAIIARSLQGGDGEREIRHRVVMDEAEVFLATRVVALCLEPVGDIWLHLATGLDLIAELYRARGDSKKASQLGRNAAAAREGCLRGNAKCPQSLRDILLYLRGYRFTGSPGDDWLLVRRLFEESGVAELETVARLVVYLMGFNRGRRISDSLAEIWQRRSVYEGARTCIERAITEDQIIGTDGKLDGINVMTMHQSKGKEFDGVIILHLGRLSPLSPDNEVPPLLKSRRLLRVGVTRAKHHVLMLTDASSPSPLLAGHNLNRLLT